MLIALVVSIATVVATCVSKGVHVGNRHVCHIHIYNGRMGSILFVSIRRVPIVVWISIIVAVLCLIAVVVTVILIVIRLLARVTTAIPEIVVAVVVWPAC